MEVYWLRVRCSNCGHKWALELPKGQIFSELGRLGQGERPECPICACFTVQRDRLNND